MVALADCNNSQNGFTSEFRFATRQNTVGAQDADSSADRVFREAMICPSGMVWPGVIGNTCLVSWRTPTWMKS
jgi:hypothetical protein